MMTTIPRFDRLIRKRKSMFLSYDHGLEHGPANMNERNVDPQYILDIAIEGGYTGVILHHGIAEKYYHGAYKEVPLIIKLNGKTSLSEPVSRQICSVKRAVKIGADAVGYTIYDGSKAEPELFNEFGRIVEEAHDYGLPVIAWMYPKGKEVEDDLSNESIAYAARVALELGADFIKIKYNGDLENLQWVERCSGRAKLLISSQNKKSPKEFLNEAYDCVVEAGCSGIVVGKNVWMDEKPFSMSKALEQVVFHHKRPSELLHLLQ